MQPPACRAEASGEAGSAGITNSSRFNSKPFIRPSYPNGAYLSAVSLILLILLLIVILSQREGKIKITIKITMSFDTIIRRARQQAKTRGMKPADIAKTGTTVRGNLRHMR
jgi:hypothetical protein